jgi:hypothetical protein
MPGVPGDCGSCALISTTGNGSRIAPSYTEVTNFHRDYHRASEASNGRVGA